MDGNNTTYWARIEAPATVNDAGYMKMSDYLTSLNIPVESDRVFRHSRKGATGELFTVFTDDLIIRYECRDTEENGVRIGDRSVVMQAQPYRMLGCMR